MIKTVETFDHNFEIKFNADKSMLIISTKIKNQLVVVFNSVTESNHFGRKLDSPNQMTIGNDQ